MGLAEKKLFLFDIDGTLAVEDTLYDGTVQLLEQIAQNGGVSCFITNNSTKSNEDYVKKFAKWNIFTKEEYFVTAGYLTQLFLKENYKDQLVFVCGTDSYKKSLKEAEINVTENVEEGIACVLVAYDSQLTYEKLVKACQILSTRQIPFYATNPDLVCPSTFGFVPDCGSICKMITTATGKEPQYLGKPNKEVAEICCERFHFSKEETIVVGDRWYTDIACGINAGVDTCVLFTGEAKKEELKTTIYQPTYAFENIKELSRAYQEGRA